VTSPSTKSLGRNQAEEWSTASREAPAGPRWVGHGQTGPGSDTRNRGSGGRGWARRDQGGASWGWAVWSGAGHGWGSSARRLGGGGPHAWKRCERERSGRKKGRGRVLYPLMFIGSTHQPTTISGLAYVVTVAPYVCLPPDEHKLRMSVFKPTNIIRNMNVGPDEHEKTNERMPFSCSVRIVPWVGSFRFATEAHKFVGEVAEVDWFMACLVGLCLVLDR
jgi:hypothetical protein